MYGKTTMVVSITLSLIYVALDVENFLIVGAIGFLYLAGLYDLANE